MNSAILCPMGDNYSWLFWICVEYLWECVWEFLLENGDLASSNSKYPPWALQSEASPWYLREYLFLDNTGDETKYFEIPNVWLVI